MLLIFKHDKVHFDNILYTVIFKFPHEFEQVSLILRTRYVYSPLHHKYLFHLYLLLVPCSHCYMDTTLLSTFNLPRTNLLFIVSTAYTLSFRHRKFGLGAPLSASLVVIKSSNVQVLKHAGHNLRWAINNQPIPEPMPIYKSIIRHVFTVYISGWKSRHNSNILGKNNFTILLFTKNETATSNLTNENYIVLFVNLHFPRRPFTNDNRKQKWKRFHVLMHGRERSNFVRLISRGSFCVNFLNIAGRWVKWCW